MDERTPINRLTEREKQVLRAWLQHKTAKEIALDFGISYYAVEKRLKMARTKLGVSSSLEAARLLADAEGYQQPVAQSPDLETATLPGNRWFSRPLALGVMIMTILAAALLVFSQQGGTDAAVSIHEAAGTTQGNPGNPSELQYAPATPERVREFVRGMFDRQDKDGSGYIEQEEGPESLVIVGSSETGEPLAFEEANITERLEGEEAWARYLADSDTDGDGRVSHEEFAGIILPQFLERGIPLLPADWESRQ
ncbi:LuxR C-terminal-related transcriptional regulator [Alteraurantiacibacter aquimixticola]|uniref:Uncharacterized protein n=1 Tax=Alteraurantiacibacter aquimixticola TaxID=2489173 RepID=A0A4V6UGC8_9SPHN|nr:LuxR C-terminal-related transcriptional regulator [Alteraurantiacibacter aquimixticola]TIX52167.1 hypothetical protein E5222_06135 [Alteraurantiacibacter aquimixticola]